MPAKLTILGSAAGGAFPQWNCGCPQCTRARAARTPRRTQDSIGITAAPLLVNASPDVLAQWEYWRPFDLGAGRTRTPLHVALTNGDLDHVLGLFSLRENQPLVVHSTAAVRDGLLSRNALFRTLQRFPGQLTWEIMELDRELSLGNLADLRITPRPMPGKLPIHLEGLATPSLEDNVALWIRSGDATIVYASAVAQLEDPTLFDGADVLLFDGTFWTEDELIRLGVGTSRAKDMAHLPISGATGSMARLANAKVGRKIYTHINNTNPILDASSPERREVEAAGWEVACDGMEIAP